MAVRIICTLIANLAFLTQFVFYCFDHQFITICFQTSNSGVILILCFAFTLGGASSLCGGSSNVATRTRFCGTNLNTFDEAEIATPICGKYASQK